MKILLVITLLLTGCAHSNFGKNFADGFNKGFQNSGSQTINCTSTTFGPNSSTSCH